MGRRSGLSVLFATGLAVLGCGEPPPPSPSAVIRACPSAVCVGDDFLTSIHLDATRSAPRLTLVEAPVDPNEPPLKLRWSFAGSAILWDLGGPTEPDIAVSMEATRPLHVTLHVENGEGGEADALKTIALTPLDENGECLLPDPNTNACTDTKPCQQGYVCVNGKCQEDTEDCFSIGVPEL